jgi:DNA-3-methyladenine glycosylase I
MSKDLVKRGFKFVGSTICYAFMQAVGIVDFGFRTTTMDA